MLLGRGAAAAVAIDHNKDILENTTRKLVEDLPQRGLRPRADNRLGKLRDRKHALVNAAIEEARACFLSNGPPRIMDVDVAEDELHQDKSQQLWKELTRDLPVHQRVVDHWLLDSLFFRGVVNFCVLMNTVQLGLEADYPEMASAWNTLENVFCVVFLMEAICKVAVERCHYFTSRWNLLDFGLVWMAILDMWVFTLFFADTMNFSEVSILRILRFLRLVRIVRLVKQFKQFVLVIAGVVEAMEATFWVAGVLTLAIYVGAVFCVGFLGKKGVGQDFPGYSEDVDHIDESDVMQNFNPHVSFGSVGRAMFTLFNVAILSEWTEVVRPLMVRGQWQVIFFIFFVMFVTFGIMNVIIGMIVDNVMENARTIAAEEEEQIRIDKVNTLLKITKIVAEIDNDRDGFVTTSELKYCLEDPLSPMKSLLEHVDLPKGFSPHELLCMLDQDGSGVLDHQEFIQSLYRLIDSGPFHRICIMQCGINTIKHQLAKNQRRTEDLFRMMGVNLEEDSKPTNSVDEEPETIVEKSSCSQEHPRISGTPAQEAGCWLSGAMSARLQAALLGIEAALQQERPFIGPVQASNAVAKAPLLAASELDASCCSVDEADVFPDASALSARTLQPLSVVPLVLEPPTTAPLSSRSKGDDWGNSHHALLKL